ncbi:uncharacterized protein LOC132308751 [Cornus florida]|uniref:uncharacterized protein LOC132308751 n=1 Tax=Cornus florida TaxID=4283 RepID=UPI002898C1C3|nr:uncharacterized protein LOC132308751 [Cornus florida]
MVFKLQREEEEEEDREPLMNGRVVVVEYLESSMSQELLCKFPDNSAFDFDYTQSSIWSPLVSRHFPPIVSIIGHGDRGSSDVLQMVPMEFGMSTHRKLSYEEERDGVLDNISSTDTFMKKVTTNLKKKITNSVSNNLRNLNNHYMKKMKRKKKKKKAFDFSPNPPSAKGSSTTPTPQKGWAKVLKAASKHFKKKSQKKDCGANYITQPNYFRDANF